MRNLDEIMCDRRNLMFISDGTSGCDSIARLLNDIPDMVAEIRRLRDQEATR